jgi:5-methylcytosine-specific restriction endonuclease McrA
MNLYSEIVLVLNKNWQAINTTFPCDAISMMYTGNATGLDIKEDQNMIPLNWKEWIKLSCDDDYHIKTINGKIKIPKIIILCNYNKVPKKRPKFTTKNVWKRDNGICQYTGKKLNSNEGNIDHIIPKSRGGETDWSNCVLSHKEINAKKADRTPDEAGLKLIKPPISPKELPTTLYIKNKHNIKEWDMFLKF